MSEEHVTQVFTVRGRPVGFVAGRWGGSLAAVERGYFPVSQTGYRSLCGMTGEAVTPEFLESLAHERDRETKELLRSVRSAVLPEPDRLMNYIHVSMPAEKALQDGFFAPDTERAELWPAAHRLFCLIDTDARFQPASTHDRWTQKQCDDALAMARDARRFLERCAKGDFPLEAPLRFFAARAYLKLPPNPGGEPAITLAAVTPELSLNLAAVTAINAHAGKPRRSKSTPGDAGGDIGAQLGLFNGDDISSSVPTVRTDTVRTARPGISP